MHSLLNFVKFNKECICWCMNFIDIKKHGSTIKNKKIKNKKRTEKFKRYEQHQQQIGTHNNSNYP